MAAALLGAEEADGSVGYLTVEDEFCGVGVGGGLNLFNEVAHDVNLSDELDRNMMRILILKVNHLQCVHVSGKKFCGPRSLARVRPYRSHIRNLIQLLIT